MSGEEITVENTFTTLAINAGSHYALGLASKGLKKLVGSKASQASGVGDVDDINKSTKISKSVLDNRKEFKNIFELQNHYTKHGDSVKKALNKTVYVIDDYILDANYVIRNGIYVPELNAYIHFAGYSGKTTKYLFVGVDRVGKTITTFHIKTVEELIKKAPSLNFEK